MDSAEKDHEILLDLLENLNFSKRYYAYYEQGKGRRERMAEAGPEIYKEILATSGLTFTYDKKEKFFRFFEKHERFSLGLHVAVQYDVVVEFILVFHTNSSGEIGDIFTTLCEEIEERHDPDFEYTPAGPNLRFQNLSELQDAIMFGVNLFKEVREAVANYKGW